MSVLRKQSCFMLDQLSSENQIGDSAFPRCDAPQKCTVHSALVAADLHPPNSIQQCRKDKRVMICKQTTIDLNVGGAADSRTWSLKTNSWGRWSTCALSYVRSLKQVASLSLQEFFSLSGEKSMLPKGSGVGDTSMRNSSLNSLVQNYMLQTMYFLRDSWMELIFMFKLEVLLFCSMKFILVSNYDNVSVIPSMAPFQHYKHTCSSICKSTGWVYHILQIKFALIKLPSFLVPVTEWHNSLVFCPLVNSSSARRESLLPKIQRHNRQGKNQG